MDHQKAANVLEAACEVAGIEPAKLTASFAEYYPVGQVAHGWRDPVAALVKTKDIQIDKVLKNGTGPSGSGRESGSNADKYQREAELLGTTE